MLAMNIVPSYKQYRIDESKFNKLKANHKTDRCFSGKQQFVGQQIIIDVILKLSSEITLRNLTVVYAPTWFPVSPCSPGSPSTPCGP